MRLLTGRIAAVMLLLSCAALPSPGQALVGTIRNFRVPEFDEKGTKKSEIFGDEVQPLQDDPSKVRIKGLRILVYKDGGLDGTIVAAECVFDRKTRDAYSNADVRIDKGKMQVTGKGFRWYPARQCVEILNDVRVVVTDAKMWVKEIR